MAERLAEGSWREVRFATISWMKDPRLDEPEDQLRKPGSCGHPYGNIEVRIVRDDGSDAAVGEAG